MDSGWRQSGPTDPTLTPRRAPFSPGWMAGKALPIACRKAVIGALSNCLRSDPKDLGGELMERMIFDEYATEYDSWFLKNRNILESEVLLLEHFLSDPHRAGPGDPPRLPRADRPAASAASGTDQPCSSTRLTKSSRLAGQLRAFLWMSIRVPLLRLIGLGTPTSLAEEARMDNPFL